MDWFSVETTIVTNTMNIALLRRIIRNTVGPSLQVGTAVCVHDDTIDVQVGGSPKLLRGLPVIGGTDDLTIGSIVSLRESDGRVYAESMQARQGARRVTLGTAGSGGAGLSPHAMSYHTDENEWHAGLVGSALHIPKTHTHLTSEEGGLLGSYVRVDDADTITAQHTFAPAAAQAPFILGANALGQLVTGLQADQLNKSVVAGAGLAGGGLLTSTVTIVLDWLGTPVTIEPDNNGIPGSSLYAARIDHQHGIVCAAPGANSVSLAASAEGGATSFARSDHTHSLDESIEPVWTGQHVFQRVGEQARLAHNADNYTSLEVGPGGSLTVAPTGDFIFRPRGFDILPDDTHVFNIGSLQRKYLALHAAELWVEQLVAHETRATIGGRILVGPTTILTQPLSAADTTIYVRHNNLNNGDILHMEGGGKLEFMQVTNDGSPGTPVGLLLALLHTDYAYTVTRDLDGSGANNWDSGEAVFNTRQIGDGFIDLYSVGGVLSGTGPTIVGNVRYGNAYQEFREFWAIGNLNSVYGYDTDVYGVGLGEFTANKAHITIDSVNGIRFFDGTTTTVAQWDVAGNILVGQAAANQSNVYISAGGVQLRTNTTTHIDLQADGDVFIGEDTSAAATTNIATFTTDQTYNDEEVSAGDLLIGDNSADKANMFWDKSTGKFQFRGGTTMQVEIGTDGSLLAGDGDVILGAGGITILADTLLPNRNSYIRWVDALSDTRMRIGTLDDVSNNVALIHVDGGLNNYLSIRARYDTSNYTSLEICGSSGIDGYALIRIDGAGVPQLHVGPSTITIGGAVDLRIGGGLYVGSTSTDPDADCLHLDGSIKKSTALGCRARRSIIQSLTNNTVGKLLWDTQVHDTDEGFAPTSTRLYAKHAGYYMAGGGFGGGAVTAAVAFRVGAYVKKNDSTYLGNSEMISKAGEYWTVGVATGMFHMAVDDYVEVCYYHNRGSNINTGGTTATDHTKNHGWLMRIA